MVISERRKSNRLLLTVPLRVHGEDLYGVEFKESGQTVELNRHGARIRMSRPLVGGQRLRLVNTLTNREAEFRVVGPTTPPTEKGGEWSVEYLDGRDNIWGIQFPPEPAAEGADSAALVECRRCHTVALRPLSLVEVEVLETAGILSKRCETCGPNSPVGYPEKEITMGAPPGGAETLREATAAARERERRRHRRVALQMPVLVRDYYGGVEVTKSENVSKGGVCFAGQKSHYVGEGLMVACPHNPNDPSSEVRAILIRRDEIMGTDRKVYGVRYQAQKPWNNRF